MLHPIESQLALSSISSRKHLAAILGVKYGSIAYHVYKIPAESRYRPLAIGKRKGGIRQLHVPVGGLKAIQRRLADLLVDRYQSRMCVHGYAPGKSAITNAKVHCRRRYVLNVDLKDFFPSINFGRVRGMFLAWPCNCNVEVATLLAQICCHENQLPQGAPTSPVVSNMICGRLDSELTKLAANSKCSYSRYADDLTFSTDLKRFPGSLARWEYPAAKPELVLGNPLSSVIEDNGFVINHEKSRLQHRAKRQMVTGIKVNSGPNVTAKFIAQLRAMLYAWRNFGLDAAQQEFLLKYDAKHRRTDREAPKFADVVWGKLSYLRQVKGTNDHSYRKYAKEYFELTEQPIPWESLSLFYCYSHDDESLLDELSKHLAVLKRENVLSDWHDRRISPGQEWESEIAKELSSANIILLLVSSSFLSSDYCWHIEMKKAIERHKAGTARVIPVILRDCDWQPTHSANFRLSRVTLNQSLRGVIGTRHLPTSRVGSARSRMS